MLDTYTGATRVIFIVGDPIAQVKAPEFVTRSLRQRGSDVVVVPAHVRPSDLPDFMSLVSRMPNVDGVIATVPHKFDIARLCYSTTSRARSIGAVNAVRRDSEGRWRGDMCDGEGYVDALRKAGFDPAGRCALLVGAGGAGSAIAHALVDAGVSALALHDIDIVRRDALLAKLEAYAPLRPTKGSMDPTGFDIAINATPLGMSTADPLPIALEGIDPAVFIGDVVTMPALPALIARARAHGCRTLTGIEMFEAVRDCLVSFYLGSP